MVVTDTQTLYKQADNTKNNRYLVKLQYKEYYDGLCTSYRHNTGTQYDRRSPQSGTTQKDKQILKSQKRSPRFLSYSTRINLLCFYAFYLC